MRLYYCVACIRFSLKEGVCERCGEKLLERRRWTEVLNLDNIRSSYIEVDTPPKKLPSQIEGTCLYCGEELTGRSKKYCCSHHGDLFRYQTATKRRIFWPMLRGIVFERDGRKCRKCGASAKQLTSTLWSYDGFEAHHILPISEGGDMMDTENLITLCLICHKKKHGRRLRVIPRGHDWSRIISLTFDQRTIFDFESGVMPQFPTQRGIMTVPKYRTIIADPPWPEPWEDLKPDTPMVSTFNEAMDYIIQFGRKSFRFYCDYSMKSIVLTGGSIKHPITVSLIESDHSGRNFGTYYNWTHYCLVVKDDKYRTKYNLWDKRNFDAIREEMTAVARELGLKLYASSQWYTSAGLDREQISVGLGSYPTVQIRHRPDPEPLESEIGE